MLLRRPLLILAVLALLLIAMLTLLACTAEDKTPPCTPVEGYDGDPCEPDVGGIGHAGGSDESVRAHGGGLFRVAEPAHLVDYLAGGLRPHLVVRGTFLPDTIRCVDSQAVHFPIYRRDHPWSVPTGLAVVQCFVDVQVHEYFIGEGPSEITSIFSYSPYWDASLTRSEIDEILLEHERSYINGDADLGVPAGGLEGLELILFIGPAMDHSFESWDIFWVWDLERHDDGTVRAIHPEREAWKDNPDFLSRLEMTLPEFKKAVVAGQALKTEYFDGRVGLEEHYPDVITNGNLLYLWYSDPKVTNDDWFPPKTPPAPCGKAVPDRIANPDLAKDCETLLAVKDELRGTGTLNWSVDIAIAEWDGVKVVDGRVNSLTLGDKGLNGTIPAGLADLTALESLWLSGNELSGCVPSALREVSAHDVDSLGLPDCG